MAYIAASIFAQAMQRSHPEGLFCPMCRSQVLVRPAAPTAQGFALDLSCTDEYCLWTALMDVTWPELYPELTTLNPEPETRN